MNLNGLFYASEVLKPTNLINCCVISKVFIIIAGGWWPALGSQTAASTNQP